MDFSTPSMDGQPYRINGQTSDLCDSELFNVVLDRLNDTALGSPTSAGTNDPPPDPALVARLRAKRSLGKRYQRGEVVGRGGMGDVLRVRDAELDRDLAMKVSRHDEANWILPPRNAPWSTKLIHEARITGQLHHPGIVPVHEIGVDSDDRPYFTMQLVEGTDLSVILDLFHREEASEEWNLARLLQVLLRSAEAVSFAHSKSVLHRDLKPANIMVGEFGEVYVMDWGLAERIDEGRKRDRSVSGTPAYMSPEQARGDHDLDARSDVYSLGAILYHILAGHAPYRDTHDGSPRQTLLELAEAPPSPLHRLAPRAPAELVAICEKAMARKLHHRYRTAHELVLDLRAYLEGRVVSAHRAGPYVELVKWVRRNRPFASALGALFASLVIGLTVTSWLYLNLQSGSRELLLASIDGLEARHRQLLESEASLWPPTPPLIPELKDWVQRAHQLAIAVPKLRSQLERVHSEPFEDEKLIELEERLASLMNPESGAYTGTAPGHGLGVARRLEIARQVAAFEASQSAAKAAPTGTPGLVPLGPDPKSQLDEFAYLPTGDVPVRNELTGALELTEHSALVFVAIPGGMAWIGASDDPASRHFDPMLVEGADGNPENLRRSESPVHAVEIAPFYLSKYEVNQAQWARWTAETPWLEPRGDEDFQTARVAWDHPVETVSWTHAREVLDRFGLRLPSEPEWEYSGRAGSSTPWPASDLDEFLSERPNLLDRSGYRMDPTLPLMLDYDDGWAWYAPVDVGPANAFGLVHMHGNVSEWCSDFYRAYGAPAPRPGTARRAVYRGGSFFDNDPALSRSSHRGSFDLDVGETTIGIRPALTPNR